MYNKVIQNDMQCIINVLPETYCIIKQANRILLLSLLPGEGLFESMAEGENMSSD